jgi:divalent metal cation (Fe/Co/Zn/Cd) transporter
MVLPRRLHEAIQEKKRAALLSIGSAMLLLGLKTFLVVRTGSLGVLSEALHSGLDLVAAVITFLSVRVSDQPADERHPYGHGKFENFSAFMETGLLIITALYIIYEAFYRLFFHSVHVEPSLFAIVILFVALGIDVTRARALNAVAKKHTSEALDADALHFSASRSFGPATIGISPGLHMRTHSPPWVLPRSFCGWVYDSASAPLMLCWTPRPKDCTTKSPTQSAAWMVFWT